MHNVAWAFSCVDMRLSCRLERLCITEYTAELGVWVRFETFPTTIRFFKFRHITEVCLWFSSILFPAEDAFSFGRACGEELLLELLPIVCLAHGYFFMSAFASALI